MQAWIWELRRSKRILRYRKIHSSGISDNSVNRNPNTTDSVKVIIKQVSEFGKIPYNWILDVTKRNFHNLPKLNFFKQMFFIFSGYNTQVFIQTLICSCFIEIFLSMEKFCSPPALPTKCKNKIKNMLKSLILLKCQCSFRFQN